MFDHYSISCILVVDILVLSQRTIKQKTSSSYSYGRTNYKIYIIMLNFQTKAHPAFCHNNLSINAIKFGGEVHRLTKQNLFPSNCMTSLPQYAPLELIFFKSLISDISYFQENNYVPRRG
jgi:hypothetical protein